MGSPIVNELVRYGVDKLTDNRVYCLRCFFRSRMGC